MTPRFSDERGFVVASLLRLVIVLILFGLVAVEGGSILYSRIALDDAVQAAAVNAADKIAQGSSLEGAKEQATNTLAQRDEDARLVRFEVLPDGNVRVTARKQATTILVHRIGFLKDLAVVEAEATGGPGGLI